MVHFRRSVFASISHTKVNVLYRSLIFHPITNDPQPPLSPSPSPSSPLSLTDDSPCPKEKPHYFYKGLKITTTDVFNHL